MTLDYNHRPSFAERVNAAVDLALTARRRPDLIAAARAAGRLSRADEACLKRLGL